MSSKKDSLLWKLEIEGNSFPSYLFGTMHVQDLRAFGQLELIKGKIEACDIFAVEFDLEDAHLPTSFQNTLIPDGKLLTDYISNKKFEKLRKVFLKVTGFDLSHGIRTKPFLTIGTISSFILKKDMPLSLDEYLWQFAKQSGKTLLGIETLDSQLNVLSEIPMEKQVKMLLGMAKNISSSRKGILHMAELYAKGDLTNLHRCVKKQAGGLRKIMLYRRNEVMANRIFEMASEAPVFAAVGAGHLGGGKGVLRKLKHKGMKVKAVI